MSRTHGGHAGHMPAGGDRKALVISGWLTGLYFVVELGIGIWTGSVAVISDAFHTFSAVGGVLYRAVTDTSPPDAVARIRGDTLAAGLAAVRGKYSAGFLQAIEWALRLDEKLRPQDVEAWRGAVLLYVQHDVRDSGGC